MSEPQPEKIGESRAYWTHNVAAYPSPVAQFRMAQLIDLDDRLYENARIVYRFLVGWYHEEYGDALLSMRHVSKVMRARAPDGANVLSHSVVQRAIIALMETGWVARTFKGRGRGKGASRYVPVLNVLDLASQGKFPELSHRNGTVEPSRSIGTVVSHAIGTVEGQPSHLNGTKTLLPDPRTDAETGKGNQVSAAIAAHGLSAAPDAAGFERVWKAYGRLGNKVAARAAFDAIKDPNVAHIAERAASWAASAKPDRKRMPLEKWLAAEKYDEADRQPKAQKKPIDNDNRPQKTASRARKLVARRRGTITRAVLEGQILRLTLLDAGEEWESIVVAEADSLLEQHEGQRHLEQIWMAGGKAGCLEQPMDLCGIALELRGFSDGTFEWVAQEAKEAA